MELYLPERPSADIICRVQQQVTHQRRHGRIRIKTWGGMARKYQLGNVRLSDRQLFCDFGVQFDLERMIDVFAVADDALPVVRSINSMPRVGERQRKAERFDDLAGHLRRGWLNQQIDIAHGTSACAIKSQTAERRALERNDGEVS